MIKIFHSIIFLVALIGNLNANENPKIEKVVSDFMDALNNNNAEIAKGIVMDDAFLTVVYKKDNRTLKRDISMNDFISDIEKRTIKVEEKIWNLKINVNENIASAWMDYDFHIEGKFSHKGSNVILLTKMNEKWLISHILFDRN